jgi:hypothetical protein
MSKLMMDFNNELLGLNYNGAIVVTYSGEGV